MQTQHLFFRKHTYYYVARVPQDLTDHFPVKTIWRSLKTECVKSARTLIKNYEFRAERLFMQIRSGVLTDEQISRLVAEFLHDELADAEKDRTVGGSLRQSITVSDPGIDFLSGIYSKLAGTLQKDLARCDLAYGELIADAIIEKHGLDVAQDTEEYRKLCREVMKCEARRLGIESQRTMGNYDSDLERSFYYQHPRPQKKGLMLSEAIKIYSEDRITEKKWNSPKTIKDMESSYNLLLRVRGDFSLSYITYDFAREFRKTLRDLPANSNKGRFAGKTAEEILAMADYEKMSISNFNKNIGRMCDLVAFAIKKELVTGIKNHFEDFTIVDPVPESEKRRPFTDEEISKVLTYLFGLLERKRLSDDQRLVISADYIWIFLLGLFTGFRSNELCQLTVEDVLVVDGIPCLAVKHEPENNKTTKNLHSRRLIPVPPQLTELGFLKFVEGRRTSGNDRLWVSVSLDSFGKWNRNFGRNINKYIDQALGGKDKTICYHSTRHNLGNALNGCEVDLKTIQDIKGHAKKSTEERTYLKKNLDMQLKALSLLEYGIDLNIVKNRLATVMIPADH